MIFFYLGEPARHRRRRLQASQIHIHGPTLRNVVFSRRAVGLSATMFFDITSYRAYAIRPYEQHLLYGCIAYALMSKNISASIPLARPSATFPRFAANHPIPSPAPFSRAANSASGPSLKKTENIIRIRLQICNRRRGWSRFRVLLALRVGESVKKCGCRIKTTASNRKRRHSLSR